MKPIFLIFALVLFILYFLYRFYWGGKWFAETLKKDENSALRAFSKSVDKYSWIMLIGALACALIYKQL